MERKIYEGKAKVLFTTEDTEVYKVYFKDDATAFNGKKRGTIEGKGVYNASISAILFELLERNGVHTHYLGAPAKREMLVRAVKIIPIEVVVRNVVAGGLASRLGLPEGTELSRPVVELYYKSDELGDPMINRYHALAMELANEERLAEMEEVALRVNRILGGFLMGHGLRLIDFKLEFGLSGDRLLLADEISPDTCRLWDVATSAKLDKDRFRRDLGGAEEAYAEVLKRISNAAEERR